MNFKLPKTILCFFAFLGTHNLFAGTPCQELALTKFGKRVLFTPDDVERNATSVSIYDLDSKTPTTEPPDWALAEWNTRKKENTGNERDLSGFFLHRGEKLRSGKDSPLPLIIVESSASADLLKHELLHWAFASEDPTRKQRLNEAREKKETITTAFLAAIKGVPSVAAAKLKAAVDGLSATIVALARDTDIEEALIGCLMLESKTTLSQNRPAHLQHALASLTVASSPLVTVSELLKKLPPPYGDAGKEPQKAIDSLNSVKLRLIALSKP